MALTAPTPPTPPTPPTVPQVTLGGGGTVTESNADGTQTSDLEAQARAAVARGEGPLSKTTTDDGTGDGSDGSTGANGQASAQKAQNAPSQQANPQTSQGNGAQGTTQAVTADGGQAEAILGQDADAKQAEQMQALEEGRAHQESLALGGHGVLYIGFSILAFIVLAFFAFHWLKNRRNERGALRFGDFADEGGDWRTHSSDRERSNDSQANRGEGTEKNLRGRTAGEILGDIEREEERQLAIARQRAVEYKRQQAREEAARERRRQEREEAAARKEKEALRAKQAEPVERPDKADKNDMPHFDLRA
ncbi:hypothetical protein [uncultured Selenomonas sp.]|uniref:hypothetical protein n=1 Tax=uncultured Selenomonas sp. TaxID=159275 RepID=UPI0025DB963A|nr:hypothetical protein [uncultured Selenomonas sp.]